MIIRIIASSALFKAANDITIIVNEAVKLSNGSYLALMLYFAA